MIFHESMACIDNLMMLSITKSFVFLNKSYFDKIYIVLVLLIYRIDVFEVIDVNKTSRSKE